MQGISRPVVMARLIEDDDRMFLENHFIKIEIFAEQAAIIKKLYVLANGKHTLNELCLMFDEKIDVAGFISYIEGHHMVYDVTNMGMLGHNFCSYPDDYKPNPDFDEIVELQTASSDPAGAVEVISAKLDRSDSMRRTIRNMACTQISNGDFESIVLASYGITRVNNDYTSRVIPSAGAIHPLNHYFFTLNVKGRDLLVYRLANQSNTLIKLTIDPNSTLENTLLSNEWLGSSLVHIITFDISKSIKKYGSRAYRFALVEAGHSAQNAIKKATDLNIGSWEYGGYSDGAMAEALGLNQSNSGIATVLFYGGQCE